MSQRKPDFQLLLENWNTWQNGPEFLPCGHLVSIYSPFGQGSLPDLHCNPHPPYRFSPGPLADTEHAPLTWPRAEAGETTGLSSSTFLPIIHIHTIPRAAVSLHPSLSVTPSLSAPKPHFFALPLPGCSCSHLILECQIPSFSHM